GSRELIAHGSVSSSSARPKPWRRSSPLLAAVLLVTGGCSSHWAFQRLVSSTPAVSSSRSCRGSAVWRRCLSDSALQDTQVLEKAHPQPLGGLGSSGPVPGEALVGSQTLREALEVMLKLLRSENGVSSLDAVVDRAIAQLK
ncbi:unnamed protein product, partial [Polarella glacialis]